MPVTVSCPACGAVHTAPDAAIGRTLKCRKCAAPVKIPEPADELVEFEPAEEEPVAVEPEEEPVEVEPVADAAAADQPKAMKKKKKAKAPPPKPRMSPALKWGLIGGGAFVLLVGLGIGAFFAFRAAVPPPDKELAGVGWYKSEDHDATVTTYFPGGKAKYERVSFNADNLAKLAGAKEAVGMNWRMETWERKEGKRKYTAYLFTLPSSADAPPKLAEQALAKMRVLVGPDVEVKVNDDVKVGAYPAKRVAIQQGGRSGVAGRRGRPEPYGRRHRRGGRSVRPHRPGGGGVHRERHDQPLTAPIRPARSST